MWDKMKVSPQKHKLNSEAKLLKAATKSTLISSHTSLVLEENVDMIIDNGHKL